MLKVKAEKDGGVREKLEKKRKLKEKEKHFYKVVSGTLAHPSAGACLS